MTGEDELEVLRSAFQWARAGSTTELHRYLTFGGPVNLTNSNGDTLLILAAYHGQRLTVELLIQHGADPNRCNDNGQTALAAATFRQQSELVKLLLNAGADPDVGQRSARIIADYFGLTEMDKLLPRRTDTAEPEVGEHDGCAAGG